MTDGGAKHLMRFPTELRKATPSDAAVPARLVGPGSIAVGTEPKTIQNWQSMTARLWPSPSRTARSSTSAGPASWSHRANSTATHVVREHYDALDAETRSLYCLGVRSGGRSDLWALRTLRYPEDDSDITFLGVEPCWEITGTHIPCLPLSTREPQLGEILTIVGFRYADAAQDGETKTIDGLPVAARGTPLPARWWPSTNTETG